MNNQSKKHEHFEPQNSDQKKIQHPENDEEAVVKPEDKKYHHDNADFSNPAKQRERSEQPVESVKKEPEE